MKDYQPQLDLDALGWFRSEERERCAKLCDEVFLLHRDQLPRNIDKLIFDKTQPDTGLPLEQALDVAAALTARDLAEKIRGLK